MSTMITEVYDALKDAGANEEKARRAAETLANYENRFQSIETDLKIIKTELSVVKYMLGAVTALCAAILVKLLI